MELNVVTEMSRFELTYSFLAIVPFLIGWINALGMLAMYDLKAKEAKVK